MRFSQDFIEKVREANNIVDAISEFSELRRVSGRLTGLCPFPNHQEKTPSFSVSEDKQVYHCFGCKKSGNIYTFVQEMKGFNFPETVEYLANRGGIEVPKDFKASPQKTEKKKVKLQINELAAKSFHTNLLHLEDDHPVRRYCVRRGLTGELLNEFEIGYAKDEWDDLLKSLQKNKMPLELISDLGLVRPRKDSSGHYDLFRHRLMFPIQDQRGSYIGFGGRILGEGQPKYINSSESDVFNKGKIFYGLNKTAKYIRSADSVVVVEGYMDFLALYGAGIKNIVATLGTALTADHAKLIKRYTKNVVILFDGDQAGKMAAERSLPILLSQSLYPRALTLADGQDPDDYIRKEGLEALQTLIANSPELFSVILDERMKTFGGSASEKLKVVDEVAPILRFMADARLFELYRRELAQRLGESESWVARSLKGQGPDAPRQAQRPQNAPLPRDPGPPITQFDPQTVTQSEGEEVMIVTQVPPNVESHLLSLVLLDEDCLKDFVDKDLARFLQSKELSKIFVRIGQLYRQMPNKFASLSACLASEVKPAKWVSFHLAEPFVSLEKSGVEKMYQDCVHRIQEAQLRRESQSLKANLGAMEPAERQKQLEQIMNNQLERHNLRKHRNQ